MVAEHSTQTDSVEMATSSSFKTPPALSKSSSYENWKKELKAWERLTEVKDNKLIKRQKKMLKTLIW